LPWPRGSVLRINNIPPQAGPLSADDIAREFARMGNSTASTHAVSGRHPMMHRTQTLDYAIVLSGEIYLVLDKTETVAERRRRRGPMRNEPRLEQPLLKPLHARLHSAGWRVWGRPCAANRAAEPALSVNALAAAPQPMPCAVSNMFRFAAEGANLRTRSFKAGCPAPIWLAVIRRSTRQNSSWGAGQYSPPAALEIHRRCSRQISPTGVTGKGRRHLW